MSLVRTIKPAPIRMGELADSRRRLLEHRYTRVAPLRDQKILTAWNALLVSGLCHAVAAARALAMARRTRLAITWPRILWGFAICKRRSCVC